MTNVVWNLILTTLLAGAACSTALARGKGQQTFLAEISPLRTVLGAPEFRLETAGERFGGALTWSQERMVSERSDFTDRSQIVRIEGLWYPFGLSAAPFYLSAGMQHEDAKIGRQQERSHITWARTEPGETNDEWVNHDSYLSLTQAVGYRYFAKSLLTGSIAAFRDELVSSQSRNEDTEAIYSTSPDLSSRGRRNLRTGVMMQVGIFLR
jgi:hypothetical protein